MNFKLLFIFLLISGIIQRGLCQVQPLTNHDSATVFNYLQKYEDEFKKDNLKEASRHLNDVAFLFWEHNQYPTAIYYYELSLNLNKKIQNENGQTMLYNNLGMLESDIKNYEKSYDYFLKTLAARRSSGEKMGMISALINISVVLNNLKKYELSITSLEEALELARLMNDPAQMRSCYGMLSETYEKADNIERSFYYFNLYRTFHEMIQRNEVSILKSELSDEQMSKELEKQKNFRNEELLIAKQRKLWELISETERYDRQIKEYDSLEKDYSELLNKRELELELVKRDSEISDAALREKTVKARAVKERSILIIVSLTLMIGFITYGYVRRTKQAVRLARSRNDLRKAQAQLVKQEKMASIGVLTAGIAHEINNPLNYIKNGAVALSDFSEYQSADLKENFNKILGLIMDGVNRCSKIVVGLNHINRTNENMNESCNIHDILNNCLLIQNSTIGDNLRVKKKYCKRELIVVGNEGKLHQSFMNLISNGIQAMKMGGILTLETKLVNNEASIIIKDTGVGIDRENLLRIGDPFFTTKDPGEGTGLGLFITYSIIEEHNGKMEVHSIPNKGTTFSLLFPLMASVKQSIK